MQLNQSYLIPMLLSVMVYCSNPDTPNTNDTGTGSELLQPIITGAAQIEKYLPLLKNKNVGLLVNQTSLVGDTHLVDTLLSLGVTVKKIFAPEHGFRGNIERGITVANEKDAKTNLPLVSLYGRQRKPTEEMLEDIDVIVFDIQDVGTRFYTYISTMHYVMEASATFDKEMIILDRPNPNGDYVDGPIREENFKSFLALDPIPIVHGLTVGELAEMINGEGWLTDSTTCQLTVIPCVNYNHGLRYSLPVKPSPNLPNDQSVRLYPSLCLYEGTAMSIGRGTTYPFQVIGYPDERFGEFTFTPVSMEGWQMNPVHENKVCYGLDLREKTDSLMFSFQQLIKFYRLFPEKESYFKDFFNTLVGNTTFMQQIKDGLDEPAIRATWQDELNAYKQMRSKYLLYPEN